MECPSEVQNRLEAVAAFLRLVPGTTANVKWPDTLPRVWTIEIDQRGKKAAICYEEYGAVYFVKYDKELDNLMFNAAEMHVKCTRPHDAVKELIKGLGL